MSVNVPRCQREARARGSVRRGIAAGRSFLHRARMIPTPRISEQYPDRARAHGPKGHQALRDDVPRKRFSACIGDVVFRSGLSSWSRNSSSSAPGIPPRSSRRSRTQRFRQPAHRQDPGLATRDGQGRSAPSSTSAATRARCCAPLKKGTRSTTSVRIHGWVRMHREEHRHQGPQDRQLSTLVRGEDHNLVPLARVAELQGIYLREPLRRGSAARGFLGDMRFFIDVVADQAKGRKLGVHPGRSVDTYRGNWEAAARQRLDPYHLTTTHLPTWTAGAAPARERSSGGAPVRLGETQLCRRRDVRAAPRPRGDLARAARAREAPIYPALAEIRARVGEQRANGC